MLRNSADARCDILKRVTANRNACVDYLLELVESGSLTPVRGEALKNVVVMMDGENSPFFIRQSGDIWHPLNSLPKSTHQFFTLDGFPLVAIPFQGDMARVVKELTASGILFIACDASLNEDADFNGVLVPSHSASIAAGIIELIASSVFV